MIHFVHFDVQHNSYIWCENCLSVYWKYINLNDILVLSLQIIAYERLRKRMNVFFNQYIILFFRTRDITQIELHSITKHFVLVKKQL